MAPKIEKGTLIVNGVNFGTFYQLEDGTITNAIRNPYPDNWPRCPSCGDYALDGHITCGRVECDERGNRLKRMGG